MDLPIVCTADVENGSDLITLHDMVSSPANTIPGASVILKGLAFSVKARVSTTVVQISRTWEGADELGVSCEVAQWTQEMLSRVEMSQSLRDYDARLSLVQSYKDMFYQSLGYTADGDPGPGYITRNAASWDDADRVSIDFIDQGGHDESPRLSVLEIGTILTFRSIETGAYASKKLTEVPTEEDGWFVFDNMVTIGSDATLGPPSDNVDLVIEILRVGEGLAYSKHSPDVAGLSAYTGTPGLKVLVSDTGDGRAGIYTRNDSNSAWIGPAIIEGPPGETTTTSEVLAALGVEAITISTDDPPATGTPNRIWLKVPV